MNQYIDLMKTKKLDKIKVAKPSLTQLKKSQNGKCSKCKQDLRDGYYKSVINPKTKKRELVCSNCLMKI